MNWEQEHLSREWGIWPCEELVRFICKQPRPGAGSLALDIGCGAGANIPLLLDQGYEIDAIDASWNAIKRCRKRFSKLANFRHVDFLSYHPNRKKRYDLIVDVFSLSYLTAEEYWIAMYRIKSNLAPGGSFFGKVPIEGKFPGAYIPTGLVGHKRLFESFDGSCSKLITEHDINGEATCTYLIFALHKA